MMTTTIHRFSKVAWALVLMVVLSCCTTAGYAPSAAECSRLVVQNYSWHDVRIYTSTGRRLGLVVTNERRVFSVCERSDTVLRVRALGGGFDFLISTTDNTWQPTRTYTLRVENAIQQSTFLPVER